MTIERRDMDERAARIVEALYGERDPAELDPTDRSEVDSYSELRAMFRSLPDEEPPSSVSAKLLAAAASSAPAPRAADESAGAWAWVRDLFRPIVSHPGLAAAASLVLVIGVAATLYVTRKVDVEGPTLESEVAEKAEPTGAPEDNDEAPAAATPPAVEAEPSREGVATGDSDDLGTVRPGTVEPKSGSYAQPADDPSMPPELAKEPPAAADEKRRDRRMSRTADKQDEGGRVLRAEGRTKEVVDSTARFDEGKVTTRGGGSGAGGQAGPSAKPAKPAAPAPEPTADAEGGEAEAPRQQAQPAPPPPPQEEQADADKAEAPAKPKQKKSAGNPQAVRLHGQAADAATKGDCKTAMALGSKIRSLDSGYYKDVFLGDSRVRKCRTPAKK